MFGVGVAFYFGVGSDGVGGVDVDFFCVGSVWCCVVWMVSRLVLLLVLVLALAVVARWRCCAPAFLRASVFGSLALAVLSLSCSPRVRLFSLLRYGGCWWLLVLFVGVMFGAAVFYCCGCVCCVFFHHC